MLVAICDPEQKDIVENLSAHMGRKIYPALADSRAIQQAIDLYYKNGKGKDEAETAEPERRSRIISVISNKGAWARHT